MTAGQAFDLFAGGKISEAARLLLLFSEAEEQLSFRQRPRTVQADVLRKAPQIPAENIRANNARAYNAPANNAPADHISPAYDGQPVLPRYGGGEGNASLPPEKAGTICSAAFPKERLGRHLLFEKSRTETVQAALPAERAGNPAFPAQPLPPAGSALPHIPTADEILDELERRLIRELQQTEGLI